MSFTLVIEKYRKLSHSERDKGDRFERLMQAYLKTDPRYATLFKEVWIWNEFPGRSDLGGSDTGIDLVAKTHDGDYWAIQCKCYQADTSIDKPAVDSFLSTSSREFKDDALHTTRFAHRLWISTTNKWGTNATQAIKNQYPPVTRINLFDLIEAPVDWMKLDEGIHGDTARTPKKALRSHQKEALERAHEYYKSHDRGKLIMACGTGKTFNSLRIAENETDGKGLILVLVPSIALLGQTLREWSADAVEPINAVCICSDPEVSKKKSKLIDINTYSVVDLALPASTDPNNILRQFRLIQAKKASGMTVVFSTYQSIDVIAKAQEVLLSKGFDEFDLIIADEAHRTTGVTLSDEDESTFVKVHDNNFIKAKKRLYMTATPRLYSDESKSKAAEAEALLCSMDDSDLYGEDIYRIGFGEAVERDLLTDYKVLILTLNDKDVPPAVQRMIADQKTEINVDDASKLIGCINALSKQFLGDEGKTKESDPEPMRRAVAFCQRINTSKKITNIFNTATEAYLGSLPSEKKELMVTIESKHIDGTMSAPIRDEMMGWLKAPTDNNECRILTNVRVLSEGVDVPSLDAVLFLSARNSPVDVVQSVGRVMRKSPGKKYGYIIIPVVVPADIEASKALDDNVRYKVVWTVLNALRAHDDRFNATVNKIDLNKKRPDQILVGTPEVIFEDGKPVIADAASSDETSKGLARQLAMQFEELQSVVFARMVQKVGDRRYWEQWAKDVATIAERHIQRIRHLISTSPNERSAFTEFVSGLQSNINPTISEEQAVEMLAQHIITKPIFEALFEGYSFVENNAVSVSMQKMLDVLEKGSIRKDTETLFRFYESVKKRAEGIDNAEGKQRIIIELYDKFFKTAFPKMVEQLGIVYTPIEVVDFIIHSIDYALQLEFGRNISDENIHILDPFTGTGTFITRLIQSGLIKNSDLNRKYKKELHANEIVLLAYYIAAVNIENAFHDQLGQDSVYEPFEGIVLTDTFQLGEIDLSERLSFSEVFPQNSKRVEKQMKTPVRVIIGNPPYSVGQRSANDFAQNQKYEKLDRRIEETYAKDSKATSVKALYDAYIKAFRWSSDRLDPECGGVVCFISNGGWLEGQGMDGMRAELEKEFSSIWVFNLRGNARTQGELRRKEGGNVFGSGSRAPISITLLVKNPNSSSRKASINYYDIGDYHNQSEKLAIISGFRDMSNTNIKWKKLNPNQSGDWINQRSDVFDTFVPMTPDKKFNTKTSSFFVLNSIGINTSRDKWVFSSSMDALSSNMQEMIDNYNKQVAEFENAKRKNPKIKVRDFIRKNPRNISWSSSLIPQLEKGNPAQFEPENICVSLYRPFFKQFLYCGEKMIHRRGQIEDIFPSPSLENRVICVSGLGKTKDSAPIITDCVPDLHLNGDTQYYPLYYFKKQDKQAPSLFDAQAESDYIRRDGISDFILRRARTQYGNRVKKEDIFYYVYSILHGQGYRKAFSNDLKKMLPRIPFTEEVRDFWRFSKAGRKLADLHINYENVPPYEGVEVTGTESNFFTVEKMRFQKKTQNINGKKKRIDDRSTIIYNSKITISQIPQAAYDYQVNGKSAIEWIIDRYRVTIDKKSSIKNDPNEWAIEVGNPRYILDLLLSIINLSLKTMEIVESLPNIDFN